MKKRNTLILAIIGVALLVPFLQSRAAFAELYSSRGGSSAGSGSVPTCAADYSTIHRPSCGEGGGGRSWRVYQISDEVIEAATKKYTGSNADDKKETAILNALNQGADWKITKAGTDGYGGASIVKVVTNYASDNPPGEIIVVNGLNQVRVVAKKGEFYAAFKSGHVNGSCWNNRGCYYQKNNFGAIKYNTIKKRLRNGNLQNGQVVTEKTAEKIYNDYINLYKPKNPKAFSEVGAFCASPNPPEEEECEGDCCDSDCTEYYEVGVFAIDKFGNHLMGDEPDQVIDEIEAHETVTVNREDLGSLGYRFTGWRMDSGETSNNDYLQLADITRNIKVFAIYEPISATSTLSLKVKNSNLTGTYGNYAAETYAKPSDSVSFHIDYAPNAQSFCSLAPEAMFIAGGTTPYLNNAPLKTLRELFNAHKSSSIGEWNNALNIAGTNFTPVNSRLTYENCNTDARTNDNSYTITNSNVGATLTETVSAEKNSNGYTPTNVYTGVDNRLDPAHAYNFMTAFLDSNLSASASVKVPYNYQNTTAISGFDNNSVVYAGEAQVVRYNVEVKKRNNRTLNGDYATIVKNAQWRLAISTDEGATYRWSNAATGDLNENGNTNGATYTKETTMIIPDVPAGTKVCFKSAVYPANSGSDLNMKATPDGATWAESNPICLTVAKRPSVQVWGGNVFSSGSINTGLAVKRNLAGIAGAEYDPNTGSGPYVFGSWSELGVISLGQVSGFTSGSSTGYASISQDAVLTPNPFSNNASVSQPGGGNTSNFRNLSNLSFANTTNGNSVSGTGDINSARSINNDHSLLESFVSSFAGEGTRSKALADNESIAIAPDAEDDGIVRYYNDGGTINVGDINVGRNKIKVISAQNVNVNGNIYYTEDTGDGYGSLIHVPKVLIYAANNILIDCNVNHLDAVLIASNVVTCNNLADETDTLKSLNDRAKAKINDSVNSKQLYINGAVITNNLVANRTYGAATGANSIVPAEIINFDPTLYLWSGNIGSNSNNDNNINSELNVTYIHELAPRR